MDLFACWRVLYEDTSCKQAETFVIEVDLKSRFQEKG